jgi:photosystem II stability/assembly factor-like uncharacterized protein
MKTFLLIIPVLFLVISCQQTKDFPAPTDKTQIHQNGEDGDSYRARMAWIELMHGGENSNWRAIETANQISSYGEWLKNDDAQRSDEEWFADNTVNGKWIERGSNNNAGNIMVVDYDSEEDVIYAVGGDGPMFRGDFSGLEWTLVNDKLRFSTNLLKVFTLSNGKKRIVSAIGGVPHYSEDGGKTWKSSTGVTPTTSGTIYDSEITQDEKIFFVGKSGYWSDLKVYVSSDKGLTFEALRTFTTSDTRNIALAWDAVKDNIVVIEQTSESTSRIHQYNRSTNRLDMINANATLGFGADGRANLQAVSIKDTLHIYAFDAEKRFYMSKNMGQTWKFMSTFPESPWDMGVYICPSNPRIMLMGEVDAFRSINGGISWTRVNHWWEYYDDIYTKLHADMMTIKEFKKKDGPPFLLNGNHGGLYYSEDNGKSHLNIGIANLNVCQYYDVKTDPLDPYYVYAGSQDQGQQRGFIIDEATSELEQNISGDYGHFAFTGNGKSLWSVYPGGSIGYYSKPRNQSGPIAGYEINSKNETVWIPPIIPGPDPAQNVILAAGGSTNEASNGSHIIRLEYINDKIEATQLPFDFSTSGGQISAMAIHPKNKNVWFVATTNGRFYRSENSGQSFVRTASMLSEAHYLYGSCILPSTVSDDVVYLSGNGYNFKPVYKSEDGGKTFKEMSVGLPKTMVFKLAANEDESLIFAATEAGPYVYVAEKKRWYSLTGAITPNLTYWSVEYIAATRTARFGTYGRGIWDFDVKEIISSTVQEALATQMPKLYPNPANSFVRIDANPENLSGNAWITNAEGKTISIQSAKSDFIDVQALPKGIYFVTFKHMDQVRTLKFTKH